jgi:hypothetical protein
MGNVVANARHPILNQDIRAVTLDRLLAVLLGTTGSFGRTRKNR